MLRHYLEVKAQHPDALLFYRMGDFYELFFEDARQAAPLLEVALTARQKGTDNEAPMCGIPHHALESYVGKLLRLGLKVAVCDQVEDPATAKGLVRREVTRVMTPGTLPRMVRTRSRISSPITKTRAAAVNASVARRRKRGSRLTAYSSALPCGMMEKGIPCAAPTR